MPQIMEPEVFDPCPLAQPPKSQSDPTPVNGQEISRPKYTPYALRHYFASKLIEKGKDFKFIQDTMGHSKIEITLNVSGHLLKDREEAKKQTAEELATELLDFTCGKSVAKAREASGNIVF